MFTNATYKIILPIKGEDRNKYNYVYQITELSTGMKYIGSRGCKIDDVYKDLKKYKSSTTNKCFKISQKLNPLNYHYEILSYHTTREEANLAECDLHDLYNVKANSFFYNKCNQTTSGFDVAGFTTVKDKNGNTFMVSCNDDRLKTGELVSIVKNKICVKDKDNNKFLIDCDDSRFLSGELTSIHKNKVAFKD